MTQKAKATEEKISTLYYIKIKNLLIKGHKKMKRQSMEWIFANHVFDKRLVCTINKLTTKKKKLKWTKDLNRHLSKEDIQMANRNMERCSVIINHEGNVNHNHNEISSHTP